MRLPPAIIRLQRLIRTPFRQRVLRPRDIALHPARDHRDNIDSQRSQLDAQRVAVRVQGGFRGVIDRAEDVGDDAGHGTDLDNGAAGADQERGEEGADLHHCKDVRGEYGVDLGLGRVEGGDGAVSGGVSFGSLVRALVGHDGKHNSLRQKLQ